MNRSIYRSFTTQIFPLPNPKADFVNQTILITGANTGIGLEAARHFVHLGAKKVILGCRDVEKGKAAKVDIESSQNIASSDRVEVWPVDLESFASVKAFCRRASALDRLDVVIENAGVLSRVFTSVEGHERMTVVNVISTWLMALLLLPVLRNTAARCYENHPGPERNSRRVPHMVIVGSNAHFYTSFKGRAESNIFEDLRSETGMFHRYADTKLMSLLIGREVAAQMSHSTNQTREGNQVVLNIVEPGSCRTQLLREKCWPWYCEIVVAAGFRLIGRTPEMGARTYVSAACAGLTSHGVYLEDCQFSTPHRFVDSEEGIRVRKKLFHDLMEILENVEQGISENITS